MGKYDIKTEAKLKQLQINTKGFDSSYLNDAGGSAGWDSEIKALLDNYTLKSLFLTEDWVFILLDLLASEISDVEMKVAKEEFTPDGRNVITWLDNHPLNKLMEQPNPNQEYSTWMYLHVIENCLMGNAIQWYSDSLNQLHIIPAEDVILDVSDAGKLKRYIVHSQFGNNSKGMMSFKPNEIIHQRRPNPVSTFWGLSPFVPNAKALMFNKNTQDYLNSFYLRQATGQMALKLDKVVSEEAALRLMRSFEHSYTGRKHMRRTMLLPKGVEIEQISQTIADQNLIDLVAQNREKILNILRIPKHALSLAESGSLGSEEFKVSLKFMWTSAIKPNMKKISGSFTRFFREKGLLKPDEMFKFDLSHIELLRDDSVKQAELANSQMTFKTMNEIRKDLYDLPPLDGGDALPGTTEVEEEEIEEEVEQVEEEEEKHLGEINVKNYLTKNGDWFEKNLKTIEEVVESQEGELHKHVLSLFTRFAQKTVRDFKKTFRDKKSYGPKKLKAASGSRNKFGDLLSESYLEEEDSFMADFEDSLRPAVATGYELNLGSVENDNLRGRIEEVGSLDKRNADLRSRGLDAFSHISDTTVGIISDIVDKGLSEGKNVDAIAGAIVLGFGKFSGRADKIARMESFTAISVGKKAALDDASEVVPNMQKMWVNTGDERVRGNPTGLYKNSHADHWSIHGETIPAKKRDGSDSAFSNGLRYPRDVNSRKTAELIGCRCDLVMTLPSDDQQ